jgi:hypothetical protein
LNFPLTRRNLGTGESTIYQKSFSSGNHATQVSLIVARPLKPSYARNARPLLLQDKEIQVIVSQVLATATYWIWFANRSRPPFVRS